jgi:hypothetical protein
LGTSANTIPANVTGTNASTAESTAVKRNWLLSLDSWAVVAAFAAALLIRVGVLKHIPW